MRPQISFICVSDRPNHLRHLIACLRLQTNPNWELIVLDQTARAECLDPVKEIEALGEKRVSWYHVPRVGDLGQTAKFEACRDLARGVFCCFPFDDVYYMPPFVEDMLYTAQHYGYDFVYCNFILDEMKYKPYAAAPVVGRIDVGGFIAKREIIVADGWTDRTGTGDGKLAERLAEKYKHGRFPEESIYYVKN